MRLPVQTATMLVISDYINERHRVGKELLKFRFFLESLRGRKGGEGLVTYQAIVTSLWSS